jgi:hypothetical protein
MYRWRSFSKKWLTGCVWVFLNYFLTTSLYPSGIRSHDQQLHSPRRQVETIPIDHAARASFSFFKLVPKKLAHMRFLCIHKKVAWVKVPIHIKIWRRGLVVMCLLVEYWIVWSNPARVWRVVFLFNDKNVCRDVGKKELIVALQLAKNHLYTGLPDGLFSNQKSQFGSILEFLR